MVLDEPRDKDEVFDDRDVTYMIEKGLYEMIKPVKVDYVNSYMGAGFDISSGMSAGASCGSSCGSSCSC